MALVSSSPSHLWIQGWDLHHLTEEFSLKSLSAVGEGCARPFPMGIFPSPSVWFRNVPRTRVLLLPNPALLHLQPDGKVKWPLRESGWNFVIRLLFPSYSKFLTAFLNTGCGPTPPLWGQESVFTLTIQRENLLFIISKTSHVWCSKSGIQLQLLFFPSWTPGAESKIYPLVVILVRPPRIQV